MAGLDKLQVLTFLFGITVIVTTILSYQDTEYASQLKNLVDILTSGLAFFFVAYSALIIGDKKSDSLMYKYLLIVVALAAWLVYILLGKRATSVIGNSRFEGTVDEVSGEKYGGWDAVANNVARPIALGSLFMWPYLWVHWSK